MNDEETERQGQMTEDTTTMDDPTEVEDDDDEPRILVVGMGMATLLDGLGDLEALVAALEEAKLRRLAQEIKE